MDFYDPDEVDDGGAEEGASKEYQSWKEVTVFLIDANPSMFIEAGIEGADGIDPKDTWIGIALKVVKAITKTKIIGSPSDQTAVLFYGTREARYANEQPHVYVYQDLKMPSADRIRDFDRLMEGEAFGNEVGSGGPASQEHLHAGMWNAISLLRGAAAHSRKNVMVFTNSSAPPVKGSDKEVTKKIRKRGEELRETGARIDLIPMVPVDEAKSFTHSPFWSSVMPSLTDDKTSQEEETQDIDTPSFWQGLTAVTRHKAYKKRALRSTRLHIGPDFSVGVQLFANIKRAGLSKFSYVEGRNNEPIKSEGVYLDSETAATLTTSQLQKRVFPHQRELTKANPTRHPQVLLEVSELDDLRRMLPQGIHLIGFKPLSALQQWHNLREPTFMYPDEKSLPGSTVAFIALHGTMLDQDKFAVAGAVLGPKAPPRLYALLPIEETIDGFDMQIDPPGIQMIQLPFQDDVRTPETDPSFIGHSRPQADDAAVDAAAEMIQQLQLTEYFSGCCPNPNLQRHYKVLEEMAMGDDPSEQTPDDDYSEPDPVLFENAAPAIQSFKDSVYGKGYTADVDPAAPKGAKRKATDDAAQAEAAETDWKALVEADGLKKMTVPDLKVYLKAHGLPVSGKKADIVERITEHVTSK